MNKSPQATYETVRIACVSTCETEMLNKKPEDALLQLKAVAERLVWQLRPALFGTVVHCSDTVYYCFHCSHCWPQLRFGSSSAAGSKYTPLHPIAFQNRADQITKTTDQWKTKHTNNILTSHNDMGRISLSFYAKRGITSLQFGSMIFGQDSAGKEIEQYEQQGTIHQGQEGSTLLPG
jgi:hypothetical protein